MQRALLVAQLATTLPLVGLIWTIQLVHYPLFRDVGADSFVAYHAQHSRWISVIVVPLMLTELAAAGLFVVFPPAGPRGALAAAAGAALLAVVWGSTFALQVPLHGVLGAGLDLAAIDRLVATNWIRTLAWTARGALLLWLAWAALAAADGGSAGGVGTAPGRSEHPAPTR